MIVFVCQLQESLKALEEWASTWGMEFNASKSGQIATGRSETKFSKYYELNGEILQQVSENLFR